MSAVFVNKAIEAAGAEGSARRYLYDVAGVEPDAAPDPAQLIPDTAFFLLLETIAENIPDGAAVPVRIGAAMRCDDYGAFGLAFKSAPNLLGSYRRVERFGKVVTSIANFQVVPLDGSVLMQVIPGDTPRLGLTMTNEIALAAAVSISREVSHDAFAPRAVHFCHARPKATAEQDAHFRCPLLYGSTRDALVVLPADLDAPNRLGDAGISDFFDSHLDQALGQIKDPASLSRDVLDQIGGALSEGVPTLGYVAAQLGMSSRTLQRRLSEAGLAYQDLVTEARQNLGTQLLSRTDYALAEIAFLTGFSDQSTFTRAFKRWTGLTPASYRRTR